MLHFITALSIALVLFVLISTKGHLVYMCWFFITYPSHMKCYSIHGHIKNFDDHFLIVSFLPRMSAEDNRIFDTALCHFKRQKVRISNIIKETFPFLEHLRDYGFINNEIYEVGKVYYVIIW